MSHTKDTQAHYPAVTDAGDNNNPTSFYLDCADDCTLVVLDINVAGGTPRTGGAPTINGYPMTQVNTNYTCTEVCGEKWHAVWSHFVDAGLPTATIPGSLEILIPNAGGVRQWGVAHTYKAGAGKVTVLDVSTYKGGTTATANPSGTIYPTDANGLVTVTAGFGANTVPTSSHTAITTLYSHDPGTYTFFEGYRLLSAVGSVRVNFTMASDDWGWVLAAFKEADKPIISVRNNRTAIDTLTLDDRNAWRTWSTRPVFDTLLDLSGEAISAADYSQRVSEAMMTLTDTSDRSAERNYDAQDTLDLLDSTVATLISELVATIYAWPVTDTLDLFDGDLDGWWASRHEILQEVLATLADARQRTVNLTRVAARSMYPPFPSTPILDTFSVDGTPPPGDWGSYDLDPTHHFTVADGKLKLQSNALRYCTDVRLTEVSPNYEAYITLGEVPDVSENDDASIEIMKYATPPSSQSDSPIYIALFNYNSEFLEAACLIGEGSWHSVSLFPGIEPDFAVSPGDQFGMRIVNGTIYVYFKHGTDNWRLLTQATDLAYQNLAGFLALSGWKNSGGATGISWDDFGGGTVTPIPLEADALSLTDDQRQQIDRLFAQIDALLPITDDRQRTVDLTRIAAHALSLADARQRTVHLTRVEADALSLTDAVTQEWITALQIFLATATDVLPVFDNNAETRDRQISALDALVLSDAVVREYVKAIIAGVFEWAITDTVILADTVQRADALTRAVTDWLLLDDAQRRQWDAWARVADALGLTETQRRTLLASLTRLDSLFVTDATTREVRLRRTAADALLVFDQTQRQRAAQLARTETLLLTDDQKRQVIKHARFSDTLPLSDTRAAAVERRITALDALAVADRSAPLRHAFRQLIDTLAPLADSYVQEGETGGKTYLVQAFDVLDVVDNSTRRQALTRSLLEYLTLGDYAGAAHAVLRRVTDALGLTDLRAAALILQRAAVDWTVLSDARTRQWFHADLVTERLGLTDAQLRQLKLTRLELDVLPLTDAVTYVRTGAALLFAFAMTDTLGLLDQFTLTRDRRTVVLDLLGITDRTGPLLVTRMLGDVLTLTDQLRAERHFHLHEATEIGDAVARLLALSRIVLDDVTATDASGAWAERGWAITDAVMLDEQFARAIDLVLQDSLLPLRDSVTRGIEQAFITILSGIRTSINRMIGTKLWIRNPLPRWQSLGVPLLRQIKVVDVNAARW